MSKAMTKTTNKQTDLSALEISFFLHMGYFPGYKQKIRLKPAAAPAYSNDEDALQEQGLKLFRKAILGKIQAGQKHCVPLSGGLDSRAILAILREEVDAKHIHTYTYGTPGTYDYDIGASVAKAAGTKHTQIDLTQMKWSQEDLLDVAKAQDTQTMLFHHVPPSALSPFKDHVIWSGYIGDAIMGGHLSRSPSTSMQSAKMRYLKKRAESKSTPLHYSTMQEMAAQLHISPDLPTSLSLDEQILLSEVGAVTAPHIMPAGYEYQTPFIDKKFMGWALHLPAYHRHGRALFKEMMQTAAPDLFCDLPDKDNLGLSRAAPPWQLMQRRITNKALHMGRAHWPSKNWSPSPNTNYLDYDEAIRNHPPLRELIIENLQDLIARRCVDWLDIDSLMIAHLKHQINAADALCTLTSLEINLKTREGA